MNKPIVFNYQNYERLLEENRKLKEDITNLQIRCRIAESEPVAGDRDCKNCRHHKNGECSRWDCEYEPVARWIPVTERLPEVFPYKADGVEFEESNDVLICAKNGNMYVATYEVDSPDRQYWVDDSGVQFENIVAWTPLPEAYQGGDQA